MGIIDFAKIEKKWQKKWEESKVFEVGDNSRKEKFYCLDMFSYPSGEGLHIGHAFVYTLGDIFARFKRLKGYNVLYPVGYDSFGLPAENAAIKAGIHPADYTEKSIKNFMMQQKAMGWSYDWSRLIKTHESNYYRWDQWIFLKMLEKGLAYRKKAMVNYCDECNSVLANEQVINGKCWRHDNCEVKVKPLEQWFLKITDYADELIDGLDKLDWSEQAKLMQRNWIGRSGGTEIDFKVKGKKWKVFTTRPDTLFGVSFLVVSAGHSGLMDIVSDEQKNNVLAFLKKIKSTKDEDINRIDKEGVFTGSYAKHPLTGDDIPVWVGNFVVADYGGGMVMAVPAHDQRDFEFAKKYSLEIKEVVKPEDGKKLENNPFTDYGTLINSGEFDGLKSREAVGHITNALKMKKLGRKKTAFRLRDWLISRQRYWGTPIPIIYCDNCGIQAVPEEDLPVKLPRNVKFGEGNPLDNSKFIKAKCPKCGKIGRRETDTMDTFANSSWYFLRYTDPRNNSKIFDSRKANYWCPINHYIGGPEHVTMHLIYLRFYSKFLRDIGLIDFDEPTLRYFTQGLVQGKDGEKMSKSKGNIIEPLEMIKKYGADTLRLYLVSVASPDKDIIWSESGIEGSLRFTNRVFEYFNEVSFGKSSNRVKHYLNKSIIEIGKYIEDMKYNLAVIKLRELFDIFENEKVSKKDLESFVKMYSVFCPHISEEFWNHLSGNGFVSLAKWPDVDEKKIDENLERLDKIIDKTIKDINQILKLLNEKGKKIGKIYLYVLPDELGDYNSEELGMKLGKKITIYAVNDKRKYDPENKSKKVKPGRPGIFVE